ncbi:MAG: 3-deoxy-D-manno-octulosonic acid transferase [Aestuariivita sp.]|nr:3-deoxy-D-manno-octulosonic acid transferase [Aestuariivita sp.]
MEIRDAPPTLLLYTYRLFSCALEPIVRFVVSRKLGKQNVPKTRINERFGYASVPRPVGTLIWFHSASIGESLAILPLIEEILKYQPRIKILITSNTASSAKIIADRVLTNCVHQFAPIDTPRALERFFLYWKPNAGVFIESEIWPNMLDIASSHNIQLGLVNALFSQRSIRGWTKFPRTCKFMINKFEFIVARNSIGLKNLRKLGACPKKLRQTLNLKAFAETLPVNALEFKNLSSQIGNRPIWVAGSIHNGEDEILLKAQSILTNYFPNSCLILVPRYSDLKRKIVSKSEKFNLKYSVRSESEPILPQTQVYIADTIGEMGLWYKLAPIVFLGGSLLENLNGHNPYEPSKFSTAILTGAYHTNFSEAFNQMIKIGCAIQVTSSTSLAYNLCELFKRPQETHRMGKIAFEFSKKGKESLTELGHEIIELSEIDSKIMNQ